MDTGRLKSLVREVEKRVHGCDDSALAWLGVLDIAGQHENQILRSIDITSDSDRVTGEVKAVLEKEPPSGGLSFLYFGLFEQCNTFRKPIARLYIAGGNDNPDRALRDGKLSYLPSCRVLASETLNKIAAARELTEADTAIFEYVLTFAAAGILAKNTASQLRLEIPVYAGFDSGDYFLIRPPYTRGADHVLET